jgi:hypothetical protein
MKLTKIFVPITKVDAVNRLVYGRLTDETVDLSNEIMDYETSKPYFEKWSANAEKVSGGKSKGNLRAMHQPKAAGKFTDVIFDDASKAIDVVAKVVDDAEWAKVDEGVYTGFSLGGGIVGKMWKDPDSSAMRYTVDPIEGSLVDLPCNPSANFTHIKAAGVEEQSAFKVWNPENEAVAAKAVEMAKAAGEPNGWAERLDEARKALTDEHFGSDLTDVTKAKGDAPVEKDDGADTQAAAGEADMEKAQDEADKEAAAAGAGDAEPDADDAKDKAADVTWELAQKWITPDGKQFEKKADAKAHMAALKLLDENGSPLAKAIAAAQAKAAGGDEEEAEPEELVITAEKAAEIVALGVQAKALSAALDQIKALETGGKIEKGMWAVSSLAQTLESLACICSSTMWEAEAEGDGSKVPMMLGDGISQIGAALVAMAQEEVAELVADLQERGLDIVEIVSVDYIELAAAVETVKADEPLMTKAASRVAKPVAAEEDDAVKALTAERDTLQKQIADAIPTIEKFGSDLGDLRKSLTAAEDKIKALEAEPAPMPKIGGGLTEKSGDSIIQAAAASPGAVIAELIKTMGLDTVREAVIKAAQQQPIDIHAR